MQYGFLQFASQLGKRTRHWGAETYQRSKTIANQRIRRYNGGSNPNGAARIFTHPDLTACDFMLTNARLIVVGGDAIAAEIKLRLPTVIGRGREASLTLPHPLVSRLHCEITAQNGQLVVNDLGSLNGTFVNNRQITEPTELPSGDLLTIGTVTFRAVYESEGIPQPQGIVETPQISVSEEESDVIFKADVLDEGHDTDESNVLDEDLRSTKPDGTQVGQMESTPADDDSDSDAFGDFLKNLDE